MTYVIINDFVINKRLKLIFMGEDFELPMSAWDQTDQLLQDLQHIPMFAGRYRWRELDPVHYREMIAKNLQYLSGYSDEARLDDDDPVVASLNFLICCLIYCIERRCEAHVEGLRINRVSELEIAIEFHGELSMEVSPPKKKADTPNGISVVVDNT